MAREDDLIKCITFINWMCDAFSQEGVNKKVQYDVLHFSESFANLIKSYEEEIECLKAAQNVDNTTQITSQPVPVDSVEE